MKESEFYGWALPQLINSNITVKFLNKPKHLNCGGWFAEDKKELVVCTKHEDAFSIFIHEFCHFLQFRDDPQAWSLCTGTDTFFAWLQGKDFSKEDLIQTSIDEIVRINQLDQKDTEKLYRASFEKIFVDVKKGDKKIAIYDPNFGLKLFYNGRLIGKVKDRVFAKRFFDIWLNKNAKFKNLRNKLLNLD